MIKIENTEVFGWEATIRGMRNPKNSWDLSDSGWDWIPEHPPMTPDDDGWEFIIGPNDHKLMSSLAKGGPVHAKYRRMITVYMDVTAPFYWWKEFDTYKIGTVANSCSTMHKIHAKEFTLDDFSFDEDLMDEEIYWDVDAIIHGGDDLNHTHFDIQVHRVVEMCENLRKMYNHYMERSKAPECTEAEKKHYARAAKKCWRMLIQFLPTSYNQKRTIMLNYEVLHNIYHSRKNHKLTEWHTFCEWIENLPYSELIIGEDTKNISD